MPVIPCVSCGYDAPAPLCPHCGGRRTDPSFSAPGGRMQRIADGLSALPRGMGYLACTAGTKRWLVPPFLLTSTAFALAWWWAWDGFTRLIARAQGLAEHGPNPAAPWWERAWETTLQSGLFSVLAHLSGALLFLVLGFFAALYTFSLFYEAVSGPFLDIVHGRIEQRWFGVDPRNALERPTELSTGRCAAFTLACAALAVVAGIAAWQAPAALRGWLLGLALVAPFVILSALRRDFARWFGWALRVEGATLWTSLRTSLFALLLILLCLPLKFVPLIGPLLFGGAAGFATAISLLDIPFSRRGWSLRQRLAFLVQNRLPLAAFGSVASLLFLIPLIGPVLMVPAASVGGLWLLVRLDKSRLRWSSEVRAARLLAR